eukprot:3565076-Lingulodinium_polyedra.AAC.1
MQARLTAVGTLRSDSLFPLFEDTPVCKSRSLPLPKVLELKAQAAGLPAGSGHSSAGKTPEAQAAEEEHMAKVAEHQEKWAGLLKDHTGSKEMSSSLYSASSEPSGKKARHSLGMNRFPMAPCAEVLKAKFQGRKIEFSSGVAIAVHGGMAGFSL